MFAAWGMDYLKYDWCSASRIWKESCIDFEVLMPRSRGEVGTLTVDALARFRAG